MNKYVLFLLIILSSAKLFSQEYYPIKNYTPIQYKGENQNWAISQTSDKILFFANNTNLLEFNGSTWKSYPSPNNTAIRSLKAKDNKIYTGSFMEFGFWERNNFGDLTYSSLSDSLKTPMLGEEDFWNINILDEFVIFQSLKRIYMYDSSSGSFDIIESPSQKAHISIIDGTIYFQRLNAGIFKIEKGVETLVYNGMEIINSRVIGIYKLKSHLIFIKDSGELLKFDGEKISQWAAREKKLNDLSLYTSYQLSDGSILLGSISNGLYHINSDAVLLRHINYQNGLNDNTVLSIFEDTDNNIWLGLDNGISVININSPFREYFDTKGTLGTVYTAKYFKNRLYLGTNHGLFVNSGDNNNDFKLIKGSEGQVWSLQVLYGELFCGHNLGTFIINKESLEVISDIPGTWIIKKFPNEENILVQGNYHGISFLEKSEGKWKFRNKLKGFDISSRFFEVKNGNEIIVSSSYKGLYQLHFDAEKKSIDELIHKQIEGNITNIFKFEGDVYYKNDKGIFKLDSYSLNFDKNNILNSAIYEENSTPNSIIIPDESNNKLWFFTENGIKYLYRTDLKYKLSSNSISTPSFLSKNLGVKGFRNISHLYDQSYLIGTYNGFVLFDLNKIDVADFEIKLNSVYSLNSDSDEQEKHDIFKTADLSYDENSVIFECSVPEYEKYIELIYQYRLNDEPNWRNWSDKEQLKFNNLSFGNYSVQFRAKAADKLSTNTITYNFKINRPYYISNLAIALYLLGLITIAYIIYSINKGINRKKLISESKTQNIKNSIEELETFKRSLEEKNNNLEKEIDLKNQELASTQLSLSNKNAFLGEIKSRLNSISENSSEINSIIKSISKNIEQTDDRKLLEDAFNNTDIDFLKQLKAKHPELTSDDLKLCSYLRLNLSSKEIAPLLNISAKSVVMKRYRLRKKLNLQQDDNLSEYILNF